MLSPRWFRKVGDGKVLAVDGLFVEELVIAAASGGLDAEQDEARGFSVETMDGR